jgi:superfamily II DNA or RNA helicase
MEIHITQVDGAIKVNPAPPYVTSYLQYTHRSFGRQGYEMVNKYDKKLLHTVDTDGGIITFQGFFEKIKALVAKHGDTVKVQDLRTPVGEPNLQAIKDIDWQAIDSTGLRGYQIDPVVEFLYKAQQGSGILNASGGYGKTIMMAVTYAAYSHLGPTILAVPLAEVFNQTYDKFAKLFPTKHIGRVGDGFADVSSDITITTYKSLPKCSLEKCRLLLMDEIQGTTGDKILSILTNIHATRTFGYTATDENLFNNADKLIKGLFGERLIFIPYEDAEASGAVVPGIVYFVKMPDTEYLDARTIEAKIRKGIKRNDVRNKLIGDICKQVPNGWQTLVFVDHIDDHLVPLYKHMPLGTKYLHRGSSKEELGTFALTPKKQKEIIAEFKDNKSQYLLATDAFRAGVDIPNLRVVIQGAGGSSEIEILQEAYRGSRILTPLQQEEFGVGPKDYFILVDFMDSHDSTLENMSLKRMQIYKKQGWTIHEVDKIEDIDWLNSKPKVKKAL